MVWRWPDRHAAGRPAIPCTLAVVLPVLVSSTGRQIGVGQAVMCTGTASSAALHLRGGDSGSHLPRGFHGIERNCLDPVPSKRKWRAMQAELDLFDRKIAEEAAREELEYAAELAAGQQEGTRLTERVERAISEDSISALPVEFSESSEGTLDVLAAADDEGVNDDELLLDEEAASQGLVGSAREDEETADSVSASDDLAHARDTLAKRMAERDGVGRAGGEVYGAKRARVSSVEPEPSISTDGAPRAALSFRQAKKMHEERRRKKEGERLLWTTEVRGNGERGQDMSATASERQNAGSVLNKDEWIGLSPALLAATGGRAGCLDEEEQEEQEHQQGA